MDAALERYAGFREEAALDTVRELGVGEIIDHALVLFHDLLGLVVWTLLCTLIPFLIAQNGVLFAAGDSVRLDPFVQLLMVMRLAVWSAPLQMLGMLTVRPLATGAIAYAAAMLYQGQKATFPQAFRVSLRLYRKLAAAYFLWFLAFTGGNAACGIPGFFLAIVFAPAFAVMVIENARPVQAFRRSYFLMNGHRVKTLVILLVLSAVEVGATALLHLIPAEAVYVVGSSAIEAFVWAFDAVLCVVLYFSARSRLEHLDVDLAVAAVEVKSAETLL
jgi:hypothetical protein